LRSPEPLAAPEKVVRKLAAGAVPFDRSPSKGPVRRRILSEVNAQDTRSLSLIVFYAA
jgi:hypothetical protein